MCTCSTFDIKRDILHIYGHIGLPYGFENFSSFIRLSDGN